LSFDHFCTGVGMSILPVVIPLVSAPDR